MPFWEKMEIYHKNKGRIHVLEGGVQAAYEAFQLYEDGVWSPHGRYFSVWRVIDVDTNKEIVGFLDVCTGTWEGFKGKTIDGKTKSATTDNFTGWREDKPHTMHLIGEPPKWEDYIEALPINEPDPDECN